jgi:hypothetical protein
MSHVVLPELLFGYYCAYPTEFILFILRIPCKDVITACSCAVTFSTHIIIKLLKKIFMPTVKPNQTYNIPEGTPQVRIKNLSDTADGRCNLFMESGSQNISFAPGQTKDIQLDGGTARLDNVGKTDLEVTLL